MNNAASANGNVGDTTYGAAITDIMKCFRKWKKEGKIPAEVPMVTGPVYCSLKIEVSGTIQN